MGKTSLLTTWFPFSHTVPGIIIYIVIYSFIQNIYTGRERERARKRGGERDIYTHTCNVYLDMYVHTHGIRVLTWQSVQNVPLLDSIVSRSSLFNHFLHSDILQTAQVIEVGTFVLGAPLWMPQISTRRSIGWRGRILFFVPGLYLGHENPGWEPSYISTYISTHTCMNGMHGMHACMHTYIDTYIHT